MEARPNRCTLCRRLRDRNYVTGRRHLAPFLLLATRFPVLRGFISSPHAHGRQDQLLLRTDRLLASTSWSAYERAAFDWQGRRLPLYRLERVVAIGTTFVLCVIQLATGLVLHGRLLATPPQLTTIPPPPLPFAPHWIASSGLTGLALLAVFLALYSRRERLFRASPSLRVTGV